MNDSAKGAQAPGEARFRLGRIVATPGALEALEESGQVPTEFLARHQSGDWGDLCHEDQQANEDAIKHEGQPEWQRRVFSAYHTKNSAKIWVITEWNRSVTTLLLPSEY